MIINEIILPISFIQIMQNRKPRVEKPIRCIRTRGIAAAMRALAEYGPQATLETVADLAGCPKASLSRVFATKEALLLAALREFDAIILASMRAASALAGRGRRGALAAASFRAQSAYDQGSRGCPITSAGAHLGLCPWAEPAVIEHKLHVINFFVIELETEIPRELAFHCAHAIALLSDGIHINAAAGHRPASLDESIATLRWIIERT
jgi:AcrR family transcriptional regulator